MKRTFSLIVLALLAGCSGGGGTKAPDTPDYFDEITPSLRWSRAKTNNPLKADHPSFFLGGLKRLAGAKG